MTRTGFGGFWGVMLTFVVDAGEDVLRVMCLLGGRTGAGAKRGAQGACDLKTHKC